MSFGKFFCKFVSAYGVPNEIDIYEHLEDKAICEVELTRTSELQLPSIIEVIEDITNNEEYTSYYFASIK